MGSIRYLPLCLLLAACGPPPIGGAGTTNRGESIVGEILVDPSNSGKHLFLRSPNGWICRSIFLDEARPTRLLQARDVPLACSTGVQGVAEMRATQGAAKVNVEFRLDDGTMGKVVVEN